jgi:putative hydrolase of the HAD superfamily
MTTEPIRAILFDLDDTLVLDEIITKEAFSEAGAAASRHGWDGPQLQRDAVEIADSLWGQSPYRQLGEDLGIVAAECLWGNFSTPGEPWEGLRAWALQFREKVFSQALARQGIDQTELGHELSTVFARARRKRQRLLPDALEVLRQLMGNYAMGLVTNGAPDLQREKLLASGLDPFFTTVTISGELGLGKPNPAIFLSALENLGVPPTQALMVGNSLRRDIAGGHAAGLRTVWIEIPGSEEHAEIQPDYAIRHLTQLLQICPTKA